MFKSTLSTGFAREYSIAAQLGAQKGVFSIRGQARRKEEEDLRRHSAHDRTFWEDELPTALLGACLEDGYDEVEYEVYDGEEEEDIW